MSYVVAYLLAFQVLSYIFMQMNVKCEEYQGSKCGENMCTHRTVAAIHIMRILEKLDSVKCVEQIHSTAD